MRRTARQLFPARGGKTLPLSTLLLAALCVLLAAPSCHAAPQKYSRDAILSVLQHNETLSEVLAPQNATSQLTVLEIRKLRAALCQLDKSQLVELQKQLSAYVAPSISCAPLPALFAFTAPQTKYSSPAPHLSAQQFIALILARLE
jgi:hypothetical protein